MTADKRVIGIAAIVVSLLLSTVLALILRNPVPILGALSCVAIGLALYTASRLHNSGKG